MRRVALIVLGLLLCLAVFVLPAAAEDATKPAPVAQTQKETPSLSPYEWPKWADYEAAGFSEGEYEGAVYKWEHTLMGTYYRWTRYGSWGAKAKFDPAFRQYYADDPMLLIDNHIVYQKRDLTDRKGRPTEKTGLWVIDYFDTDEAQAATTKVTVPAFVDYLPVKGFRMGESDDFGKWWCYNNDTIKTIVVKAPLSEISLYSFANLTALEKIALPDTVETIGDSAFYNCKSLRRIVCKGTIKRIEDGAFRNCEQLDYRIPATLIWLGSYAYSGSGIKKVVLPLSVQLGTTDWDGGEDGVSLFSDCKKLTSVRFTGGEETKWYWLTYRMFSGCTALKTVVLPTAFKKLDISSSAFENCTSLQTIRNLNSVRVIGARAFKNCSGLRSLTIPQEIKTIQETAFEGCKGLRKLILETKDPSFFNGSDDWQTWDGDEGYGGELIRTNRNFLINVPKQCTVYVVSKDMKYAVKSHGFPGTVKIRVSVPTPKTAKVTKQNGKVTLTWSTVSAADGYRIWSYDAATGKYQKLATVKAPKTTVTLKTSARQFVIRAYRIEAGDISWSAIKAFT